MALTNAERQRRFRERRRLLKNPPVDDRTLDMFSDLLLVRLFAPNVAAFGKSVTASHREGL